MAQDIGVLKQLLANGIDVHRVQNKAGQTPLDLARRRGKEKVCRFLEARHNIPLTIKDLPKKSQICSINANLERDLIKISKPYLSEEQLANVWRVTNDNCNRFYNRCRYLTEFNRIKLHYPTKELPLFSYGETVGKPEIDWSIEEDSIKLIGFFSNAQVAGAILPTGRLHPPSREIFHELIYGEEFPNPIICCQLYRGRWGILAYLYHNSWYYITNHESSVREDILIDYFMEVNNINYDEISDVVRTHPILDINMRVFISNIDIYPKIHDFRQKPWNRLTDDEKTHLAVYRIDTEELWEKLTITTGDKIVVRYNDIMNLINRNLIPFY